MPRVTSALCHGFEACDTNAAYFTFSPRSLIQRADATLAGSYRLSVISKAPGQESKQNPSVISPHRLVFLICRALSFFSLVFRTCSNVLHWNNC